MENQLGVLIRYDADNHTQLVETLSLIYKIIVIFCILQMLPIPIEIPLNTALQELKNCYVLIYRMLLFV